MREKDFIKLVLSSHHANKTNKTGEWVEETRSRIVSIYYPKQTISTKKLSHAKIRKL